MKSVEVHRLALLSWRVYRFAAIMALLAIIPGCNWLYSGHGGPAWLVLPFVFPVTLIQLFRAWRSAVPDDQPRPTRFALLSLIAYFPISLGAAMLGAASLQRTFGLPVETLFFWGFFIFPIGLVFNGSFFGL